MHRETLSKSATHASQNSDSRFAASGRSPKVQISWYLASTEFFSIIVTAG